MSYYDHDFYREPSEFEKEIDAFKQTLMNSVKDSYKAEIEQLRKENAELQEVKKNFEQIKADYRNKEHQLETDRKKLVYQVRQESLKKLLEDYQIIMWNVTTIREIGPKCDRCDDNRRLFYTTPLGKVMYEDCICKAGKKVYVPKENIRVEFKKRNDSNFTVWYTDYGDNEDGYKHGQVPKDLYHPGMKFEALKEHYHGTYFREKEDCQRFCDWLNAQDMTVFDLLPKAIESNEIA